MSQACILEIKNMKLNNIFIAIIFVGILTSCQELWEKVPNPKQPTLVRFSSYNCSLNRNAAGKLLSDLADTNNLQAAKVAEIIQRSNADVIALLEFDYDAADQGIKLFQKNYLSIPHNGSMAVDYPYYYAAPSNTGILSGHDLNNDGKIALGDDGFGFGMYAGQYAFVILSKYPIDKNSIRTFQNFLWKDMPNAKLPKIPGNDSSYYNSKELEILRLSSKNHVDVPVMIDGNTVHVVVAHPTPPVFDGPEDRNGLRNHDENRLLSDYVKNESYLKDDKGINGGLKVGSKFVIMGDLNADPVDGESTDFPINQFIQNATISQDVLIGNLIPRSEGGKENNKRAGDKNDPSYDTAFWGLRVDYILPSANMKVKATGIFWPTSNDPLFRLVKQIEFANTASDHLLVWTDVVVK